jgi:hypothetical protein
MYWSPNFSDFWVKTQPFSSAIAGALEKPLQNEAAQRLTAKQSIDEKRIFKKPQELRPMKQFIY